MHWHAIKQSTGLFSQANPGTPEAGLPLLDGNDSRVKAPTYTTDEESPFPTGDDACDLRPGNARWTDCNIPLLAATPHDVQKPDDAVRQLWSPGKQQHGTGGANAIDLVPISQAVASSSHGSALTEASLRSLESSFSHAGSDHDLIPLSSKATVENSQTGSDRSALPFLQVSIPMHPTNSLAPFAYQRALRNRIRDDELGPGRKYDIKAYTPIFVHDCLMVPGSLATICGKGSAEDVLRRMTPALLPGFHAHVHDTTHEPMILQSSRPGDHAHGMLVFGQSKKSRRSVHAHYRHFCKRIKVEVELDTVHPVPRHLRSCKDKRWELRRRSVWAHVWVWRGAHSADARLGMLGLGDGWRFDDFLAGAYETKGSLRVEPAGWMEDDRGTDLEGEEVEDSGGIGLADEGWKYVQDEQAEGWEEASGDGGAVAWDDDAWPNDAPGESREERDGGRDSSRINSTALDRDYDRSGNAGCW